MHMIITDAWLAKTRPIHLNGTKLVLAGFALLLALMVVAAGLYHWVFLKGAREGWPIVGSLVKLVVKDEFEQRDRFMRENLDANPGAVRSVWSVHWSVPPRWVSSTVGEFARSLMSEPGVAMKPSDTVMISWSPTST